jgi:hypothetical protein
MLALRLAALCVLVVARVDDARLLVEAIGARQDVPASGVVRIARFPCTVFGELCGHLLVLPRAVQRRLEEREVVHIFARIGGRVVYESPPGRRDRWASRICAA